MALYYRGGLTWKQHLQMDAYVQDINGQIRRSGDGVTQAISDSTREMVASNDALERTFGQGFDSVNNTLEWGFDRVAGELGAMRAEFSYGLGLLHDQLMIANDQLRGILDSLDAIHETLKHPLLTQARELSIRGLERMGRGLLPEALKDLHDSAEKNEADFVVQYHIGKLYLYGRNDMDDIIDPAKAEAHLRLAARYANSELRGMPQAAKFCGDAYFHAAIARYVQSHDRLLTGGNTEDETEHLREMFNLASQSIAVYPENPEVFYHHAKYAALLGEAETCVKSLRTAIGMDRNYCIKVEADADFDGVRDAVQGLLRKLKADAKVKANRAYQSFRRKLDPILSGLPSDTRNEADQSCQQIESYLAKDAYFDYQDILHEIQKAKKKLPDFQKAFYTKVEAEKAFDPIKKLLADYVFVGEKAKEAESEIRRLFQDAELLYRKDTYFDYLNTLPLLKQAQETFNQIPKGWIEIATLRRHTDRVNSVAFSPDGKIIASGSGEYEGSDFTVKLWSVAERRAIATLTGHTKSVSSVAFSPDGKTLAFGSDDKRVKLWSVAERREIATLTGHTESVHSVAFSLDGKTLASSSGDKSVKLWSVAERRAIATLTEHSDDVSSVAFSPDGKTLASSSYDKSVKLWSVASKREIVALTGHTERVYSVAFSPDGETLASGSRDESVKLWSVEEKREIATLTEHIFRLSVLSVAFSPDGKMLASSSWDNSVKLWGRGVITRRELEELEKQRQLAEEAHRKREAEEAERQHIEAERQKNKLCLTCGTPLGFFDKLSGRQQCKRHRS